PVVMLVGGELTFGVDMAAQLAVVDDHARRVAAFGIGKAAIHKDEAGIELLAVFPRHDQPFLAGEDGGNGRVAVGRDGVVIRYLDDRADVDVVAVFGKQKTALIIGAGR